MKMNEKQIKVITAAVRNFMKIFGKHDLTDDEYIDLTIALYTDEDFFHCRCFNQFTVFEIKPGQKNMADIRAHGEVKEHMTKWLNEEITKNLAVAELKAA